MENHQRDVSGYFPQPIDSCSPLRKQKFDFDQSPARIQTELKQTLGQDFDLGDCQILQSYF